MVMGTWFTDATIAFVKEIRSNLENTKEENAKLEEKLHYYERKRNQCYIAIEELPDELRKNMYFSCKADKDLLEPVQLDEAFKLLCKRVKDLREQLELGKKQEDLTADILNELTNDYYPGILDEIQD